MTEHATQSRSRLLRVLAIVWIALISAVALIDRVAVWRLTERVDKDIEYDQLVVQSLEERLTSLEQRAETLQRAPSQVSEATFTETRRALNDRLDQIDHLVREGAHASDLVPLRERLSVVEERLARVRTTMRPANPTRAPEAVHAEPAPPGPPFTVLGIEWRGGRHFLSLAPAGAYSLDAVRVLQPGETYEGWQLESVDGKAAVFRVAGRLQRVSVP